GGPAGQLPVSVSGVLRDRWVRFDGYEDYSFNPPDDRDDQESSDDGEQQSLIVDKKPLVLDAQGGGRLTLDGLPTFNRPGELLFEASFADPNGQIQTLAQTAPVWPAQVQAG